MKVNNKGGGTCSISDVADPISGQKDGIKDFKCQFPLGPDPNGNLLPDGTHFGVVEGSFMVNPANCADLSSLNCETRAFSARQEVTILE